MSAFISIATTVTFDRQRIVDLLCTAFEGSVGYWAVIDKRRSVPGTSEWLAAWPATHGSLMVMVKDEDEDDIPKGGFLMDWEACARGLQVMAEKYPRHFQSFVDQNEDAETGDVFVQCALLGEIVYG